MNAADVLNAQIQLSNTAHQREVADLRAAGLNPVLSAHGSGADVPNIMNLADSSGSGGSSAKGLASALKYSPTSQAMKLATKTVGMVPELIRSVLNGNIKREPQEGVSPSVSAQSNNYSPLRGLLTGAPYFVPTDPNSDEWNHISPDYRPSLQTALGVVGPLGFASSLSAGTAGLVSLGTAKSLFKKAGRSSYYRQNEFDFNQAARRMSDTDSLYY